ncbi:hypothetical protein HYS79_00695 [Patescibacteria group bacterium]|nr:hypothetical protein [Patescibacteria group bacterium]
MLFAKALKKGFLYIVVGAVIDGLQIGVGLALSGIIFGIGAIPVVGTLASTVTIPIGMILGYVFEVCIGLGGGVLLTALLIHGKMFYPGAVFATYLGEALPLINLAPSWTILAYRCAYKKVKEEERAVQTYKKADGQETQLHEATT